jgi:hypothetical protein
MLWCILAFSVCCLAAVGTSEVKSQKESNRLILFLDEVDAETVAIPEGTGSAFDAGWGLELVLQSRGISVLDAAPKVDLIMLRYPSYQIIYEPREEDIGEGESFQLILRERNLPITDLWRELRDIQIQPSIEAGSSLASNCAATTVLTAFQHNAGWASCGGLMSSYLVHVLKSRAPLCVYPPKMARKWSYADDDHCQDKSPGCYFLYPMQLSACCDLYQWGEDAESFVDVHDAPSVDPSAEQHWVEHLGQSFPTSGFKQRQAESDKEYFLAALRSYIERPKFWVRQEVRRRLERIRGGDSLPCALMHVRRGDAVKDVKPRPAIPVQRFVDFGEPVLNFFGIQTIVLLTDSTDAINEAVEVEEFRFIYVEHERYSDSDVHWQSPWPSGSRLLESIIILVEQELGKECELFLGQAPGNFATALRLRQCMSTNGGLGWKCPVSLMLAEADSHLRHGYCTQCIVQHIPEEQIAISTP